MTTIFKISSFDEYIDSLYSQVFVSSPSTSRRFAPDSWLEVLLPEQMLIPSEDDSSAACLLKAAQLAEFGEVIVQSPEIVSKDRETFLVRPNVDALTSVFLEPSIGHFDHVVFDTSAEWGVFSSNELDYTAIGGNADFMSRVVPLLGGLDSIRTAFEEYWLSEATKNSFSPNELLDSVGWSN